MFTNPTVQDFIDRQIGGATPHFGAPPPTPAYRGALARALFGDVVVPRFGGFQAPAIRPGRGLEPELPTQGVGRGPSSQVLGQAELRGGEGNTGAAGLAAGISKLGAGIESGLDAFAANRQAAAIAAALRPSTPSAFLTPTAPPSPAPFGTRPPMFTRPNMGAAAPTGDIVSYIRNAAVQRGIDPDIAVKVARSEGLGSYTGDKGSSFGPFQLHYGGVAGGGNAVPGLGDTFTKATGLDARDPSTVKQQIDFSLDQAAKGGWGPWHGAANSGIGNFEGIGNPVGATQAPTPSGASTTPVAPTQTGIYQGQPYTYQTQPALGPQGMLQAPTGIDPLAMALAGQGDPNAPPMMSPGVAMLDLFGGQFGAG